MPDRKRVEHVEKIVGSLTNQETIGVQLSMPVAVLPLPPPDPVTVQAARFYVHLVHNRLGQPATLDPSQGIVVRAPRRLARQLLAESIVDALSSAADAEAAKGGEELARWYVDWAQWFRGLGIDLGAAAKDRNSDSLDWALTQSPDTLKAQLANRAARVIEKLSLTPIQLP